MITREYHCEACGNLWTTEGSIAKHPRIPCPKCGEICRPYVFGGSHFELKGVGWGFDGYTLASEQPVKPEDG